MSKKRYKIEKLSDQSSPSGWTPEESVRVTFADGYGKNRGQSTHVWYKRGQYVLERNEYGILMAVSKEQPIDPDEWSTKWVLRRTESFISQVRKVVKSHCDGIDKWG